MGENFSALFKLRWKLSLGVDTSVCLVLEDGRKVV